SAAGLRALRTSRATLLRLWAGLEAALGKAEGRRVHAVLRSPSVCSRLSSPAATPLRGRRSAASRRSTPFAAPAGRCPARRARRRGTGPRLRASPAGSPRSASAAGGEAEHWLIPVAEQETRP